ncbi:UNVERIFIED_CONTAM: hypothetical protein LK11_23175 [Mumia flava]
MPDSRASGVDASKGRSTETGAATLYVVIAVAVVVVVFAVCVHLIALTRLQHRAAAAADLAALAASAASLAGEDGCLRGRVIAAANDVEVTSCERAHHAVTVRVEAGARLWGRWWRVRAIARAAPRDYRPAA